MLPSGSGRPQPGGANSSPQSSEQRTGKNPLNETYESCVSMWERDTHMSRQQWARACWRVAERLKTLKVQ